MNCSNQHKLQINRYQKNVYAKLFFQHSEIYTLFEELIHKHWGHRIWQPLIDILEEENLFRIKIDLPGIAANEVNLQVSDSKLLIEGRRQIDKDHDSAEIKIAERPQGIFCREIEFFQRLSDKDVEKKYEDGVLTIVVKKHRR
jgi:HSP20 family molecular chaperone IbpA